MRELGCYTNEQRREIESDNYWAYLKGLVHIAWEPSLKPEDTKEILPTFLQRIAEFETHKDEPNLSIPAADLALDNLERQGFGREDRNNTWKQKLDTELRNKVLFDVNPEADIIGTGRCKILGLLR
eukprot:1141949-Pelagomonas_calceolata.AAC.2